MGPPFVELIRERGLVLIALPFDERLFAARLHRNGMHAESQVLARGFEKRVHARSSGCFSSMRLMIASSVWISSRMMRVSRKAAALASWQRPQNGMSGPSS